MNRSYYLSIALAIGFCLHSSLQAPAEESPIPDDFPRFVVPGHEAEMDSLRSLYYLHYLPGGPMATLWDEWLSAPTLWPAVTTDNRLHTIRERWAKALSARGMDEEGYVFTHQHASIAHQEGWPFPFWAQGRPAAWGWHFSLANVPGGWHGTEPKPQEGWTIGGGEDRGIENDAWNIELTEPNAFVISPEIAFQADNSPFLQIRWRAEGLETATPQLRWIRESDDQARAPDEAIFPAENRMYFEPVRSGEGVVYAMIPVFRSPEWRGKVTRLQIHFGNRAPAKVGIQAVFNQYDTRHNINNSNFIRGCAKYFWWTGDLNFLRANIQRMRHAMLYMMDELGGMKEKLILTPWVGHDGRSGLEIAPDGKKIVHPGRGIGNNYWDLLPFGHKDCYATIQYYDALRTLSKIEAEIARHPEWNIPRGPLVFSADELRRHADEVKAHATRAFWNPETGRLVSAIDIDGNTYDYGFTFLNLEATYYDFATEEQAKSILDWVAGDRVVQGDTSQGADIYHWRFGPRATTKRNVEYYLWAWNSPESIPWGGQVQDGGAVLGFTYHDLMSRLRFRGPDDAWARLQEIIAWFDEVQAAGGYRKYYADGTRGSLQGGGTPGGLGLDHEFFESILVPQIVIDGFLGFQPGGDGVKISPSLPEDWPSLAVTRVHWQKFILDITAKPGVIAVGVRGGEPGEVRIETPPGWNVELR